MSDPIRDLKKLPWSETLRIAAIVVVGLIFLEWAVELIAQHWVFGKDANLDENTLLEEFQRTVRFRWISPQNGWLFGFLGAPAMGIAATELWRYRQNTTYVDQTIGWTLVGSLLVVTSIRWILKNYIFASLLPSPLFTDLTFPMLMGIILGVFWRDIAQRLKR